MRRPKPERVKHFAETGVRLMEEREAAARIVERLLLQTPPADWPSLSNHLTLRTAGALERMANIFAQTLAQDPPRSKALAELAVSIADKLPPRLYPRIVLGQVQAHAWKDLGKALRFLGRNREAVEAFRTAEGRLSEELVHDRAIMRFNLAMSLQELDRFTESRQLITQSRDIFREYGDYRNATLCGLAEGILLQRLRHYREARESYLLLLASTKPVDQETLASLHRAIGLCSIELGDYHDAESNLLRAVVLSKQIGQPMESLKSQTAFGRLLNRKGETAHAVDYLRPVRREFLRAGLAEEAGICGLEIVEALLALGSPAENLARRIVAEFTAAGLSARAIGALGYLAEAIAVNKASTTLVTKVREYIVSLRTSPERDFVTS